jgi:hypothetical protein
MNAEKTVSVLANIFVNDRDEDVCATAAQALSVFGAQGSSLYLSQLLSLMSMFRRFPEVVKIRKGHLQTG